MNEQHKTQYPRRSPLCALPAAVAIVLFLGCGGSAPPTRSTKSPEESGPPESVPEALAELDRAEAELASAIGSPAIAGAPADESRAATGEATPRDAEPHEVSPTSPPPPAQAAGADAPSAFSRPDPCVTACRALASMSRSADHVCDLAGHGDDRCENARSRVQRATDRVRAQCPGCR